MNGQIIVFKVLVGKMFNVPFSHSAAYIIILYRNEISRYLIGQYVLRIFLYPRLLQWFIGLSFFLVNAAIFFLQFPPIEI